MNGEAARILIVEDEAAVRRVLERHLQAQGFDAVAVGDAEAALKLIALKKFSAVLLDNGLPGVMGIAALPRILEQSGAPVIMITGYPNEQIYSDALLIGAKAFFAKPLELEKLTAKLRELIKKA